MRTIYCGCDQRSVFYGFGECVLARTGRNLISKQNTVLCGSCNTAIFKWDVIPKNRTLPLAGVPGSCPRWLFTRRRDTAKWEYDPRSNPEVDTRHFSTLREVQKQVRFLSGGSLGLRWTCGSSEDVRVRNFLLVWILRVVIQGCLFSRSVTEATCSLKL